jgi:hypothetical protein
MVKKAQLTMFMLLGIIIIVFAGLVFYISEIAQKRVEVRPVEASSAKELVELCLGEVADDALLTVGKQGGKANLGSDYFEPLNTSYLYDFGENKALDKTAVEQQLSEYIDANIAKCIGSFELLKNKGIEVFEKSQPRASALITEKEVIFSISYDLEEKKADLTTRPEFMPAFKAVRLKKIIELADSIIESEKNNNGLFDLDNDCEFEVTHFPVEKTLITIITDTNFLIQDRHYRFVFAHRR